MLFGLTGCSTGGFLLKAHVENPALVGKQPVIVTPDATMANAAAAEKLAGLLKGRLEKSGFKMAPAMEKAELVVIVFAARDLPEKEETSRLRPDREPLPLSYGEVRSGYVASTLSDFDGFSRGASVPEFVMTVTAYSKDDWISTREEIPAVWTVTAKGNAPAGFQGSFLSRMLEASTPYFATETGRKPKWISLK